MLADDYNQALDNLPREERTVYGIVSYDQALDEVIEMVKVTTGLAPSDVGYVMFLIDECVYVLFFEDESYLYVVLTEFMSETYLLSPLTKTLKEQVANKVTAIARELLENRVPAFRELEVAYA